MGRNNEKNIKTHNDKLHKAQAKKKQAEIARKEKLKEKWMRRNNKKIQSFRSFNALLFHLNGVSLVATYES